MAKGGGTDEHLAKMKANRKTYSTIGSQTNLCQQLQGVLSNYLHLKDNDIHRETVEDLEKNVMARR